MGSRASKRHRKESKVTQPPDSMLGPATLYEALGACLAYPKTLAAHLPGTTLAVAHSGEGWLLWSLGVFSGYRWVNAGDVGGVMIPLGIHPEALIDNDMNPRMWEVMTVAAVEGVR